MDFTKIKQRLEEIAGSWNGDESGIGEERAMLAKEALESLEELGALLAELGIKN